MKKAPIINILLFAIVFVFANFFYHLFTIKVQATGITLPFNRSAVITSYFDHDIPDYSRNGDIIVFDGRTALSANGICGYLSGNPAAYYENPGESGECIWYDGHNGIDFQVASSTSILAVADGLVTFAGCDTPLCDGYGKYVRVWHPDLGYSTLYAHLGSFSVSQYQSVQRGQEAGLSDCTGTCTGPHLHFTVYNAQTGGNPIDPYGWSGNGKPDLRTSDPNDTFQKDPWNPDLNYGYLWTTDPPSTTATSTATFWDFLKSSEGWNATSTAGGADWGVYDNTTSTLKTITDKWVIDPGLDPQIKSPILGSITASQYPTLEFRMSAQGTGQTDTCHVFFSKTSPPSFNPNDVVNCAAQVIKDGTQRTYQANLGSDPDYTGQITAIRIDPIIDGDPNVSTDLIYIDYIKFITQPPPPIYISNPITQNTTWTSGNVYVVQDTVTIDTGVTLTIEPGAIVKFNEWSGLEVYGTLNAQGAPTSSIYFTSIKDDSIGGDTNGDGGLTLANSGDWARIHFYPGSQGNLSNVVLRYAGSYDYAVINSDGILNISDSELTNNNSCAVSQQLGGSLTLNNSKLKNQYCGFRIYSGTAQITNNQFENNQGAAGYVFSYTNWTHSGNTSTGQGKNGFVIQGAIPTNQTWNSDLPYIIYDYLSVDTSATLALESGVIVKFDPSIYGYGYSYLDVWGNLQINGLPASKVYFTSIKDDAADNRDTNGDAGGSSPAPGDWTMIQLNTGSQGNINNAVIRYAGAMDWWGYWYYLQNYAILNKGNVLNIADSEITNNLGAGIYQTSESAYPLTITNSKFTNNSYAGIYQEWQTNIASITSSEFSNQIYGLYLTFASAAISDSSFHDNTYGIYGEGWPTISNSNFTNNSFAGVYQLWNGSADISSSEFSNQPYGYYYAGSMPQYSSLSRNFFHGHSQSAVYNLYSYPELNAQSNWWGSETGPYHPTLNPNGAGDPVSDGVNFNPWLMSWPPETIPPVISLVSVSNITPTSATITWTTDEPSTSQVEYGLTPNYDSQTALDSTFVTSHSVNLTGLSQNTLYHFRVKSKDAALNETISEDYTFTTSELIYVFGPITQNTTWLANNVYLIQGITRVDPGITLTIEPAGVVKFQDSWTSMYIDGTLNAQGNPTSTIHLTSIHDDSAGGDTDGYSYSAMPGDWGHIWINEGGVANFSYASIRYGSNGLVNGGALTVGQSNISDNAYNGLYNNTPNLINAENNYWGSASGPYHPTLNPSGTGNPVSDNVDFVPWLTQWP